MKQFLIALLTLSSLANAGPSGSANQVLRIPSGGGIPKFGSIDLSQSATVGSSILPAANGGLTLGTAGVSEGALLNNAAITVSQSANAYTISLKQADGSTNCTSAAPCKIGFRGTSVGYNIRSVTGALSVTIPSGTTIGTVSAAAETLYVYLQDNAGTVTMAVSLMAYDEGTLLSTTAISGGTLRTTIYSTAGSSSLPTRLIGRVEETQATAGTWASNATTIETRPFVVSNKVYLQYVNNAGTALTASVTNIDFSTKVVDSHGTWNGTIFTAPKTGFYIMQGNIAQTAGVSTNVDLYRNNSVVLRWDAGTSNNSKTFSFAIFLVATDTLSTRVSNNVTLSNSATQHWISIYSQD